jgi:DNA-binding IclR family transcriptional regulator
MGQGRSQQGIEILDKVGAAIDALAEGRELTVKELAACVDEPVSSTYRLVSNLVRIGWVDPGSKRGQYRLGLFFLQIGGRVEDAIDIREHSLPWLRHLLETTGETAYLFIRHDLRAVCIERLDGDHVRLLAITLGASLPLVSGGAPRAILAFLPEQEYDQVVEPALAVAAAESRPSTREQVSRTIADVRRTRISISDGDITPGVAAIGAPVFNHRGEIAAAISVSGIRVNILGDDQREAVIQELAACANGISASLGWSGEISQ